MNRRGTAIATTIAIALLSACLPASPPPGSPSGACRPDPFTPEFVRRIESAYPGHHVTASAYDDRSGCWYRLRPGQRVTTASVVKAEIMAAVLLRAQRAGRQLTARERASIAPMIQRSDNASASSLWSSLGGAKGVHAVGVQFGLTQTVEVAPIWGLTSTTADDQAGFLERLVMVGPLDEHWRSVAWQYLLSVTPSQRWGVTAGVPGSWRVGLKNGFAGSRQSRWRINSVGYAADPAGGGYSVAILSDGWSTQAQGIPAVEAVSRQIAGSLTA